MHAYWFIYSHEQQKARLLKCSVSSDEMVIFFCRNPGVRQPAGDRKFSSRQT